MGMNLLHGGHLTHGSPVNRSGKFYNAVQYTVDPETERIDYDAVQELAQQYKPNSSSPGTPPTPGLRTGLVSRRLPNRSARTCLPISPCSRPGNGRRVSFAGGLCDVITFTTHKTLCGPRGACILTTNPTLARKIDRAVFPGEQGGPHVHVFAALAVTFKLAKTDQFKALQAQIVKNCVALTDRLAERGLRIPFGGTNTHLTNIDCSSIKGPDGTTLSGDQAARILDIAGIVVNRNTIPGDISAADPSGLRLGTPWVTQRGLKEDDMLVLVDIIADLLHAMTPFGLGGSQR